ncbi:hypothetical protein [Melioribacter sp. OK-6-Me]|uniref:hypothetical protein n=1 Tax=unclassified Melioribacter TaxID=2627329 RepID=UPI003ED96F68
MKKFILLFLLSTAFTGCLNYTQVTTIKTDGSGKMFIHYWMKWTSQRDSIIVEQLGLFNQDSIRKEFTSEFNKLTSVATYRDFNDSTIHAQIEFEFTNLDSLNLTPIFRDSKLSIKDIDDKTKVFSQFIKPIATGFGFESSNFSLTFIYYLPGEILSHNATEITRNKLTWKYSLNEIGTGKYITATYRPFKLKETPSWIYYAALLVLLTVIVFLFTKRVR